MGSNQVKFDEENLREFEETTPFNRAEIIYTFKVFRELAGEYAPHSVKTETEDGFANPDASLPVSHIVATLPQLKNNPFGERICNTFAASSDGNMSFTEFLDMVSSLSPKVDPKKRVFHAFQIFDIDGDGVISRQDMYNMMDMLTGTGRSSVCFIYPLYLSNAGYISNHSMLIPMYLYMRALQKYSVPLQGLKSFVVYV